MSFVTLLKTSTVLPLGILALALAATQPARAQQPTPPPATAVAPRPAAVARPAVAARPAAVARPLQTAPVAPAGDPYGFTAWLNATRASYGLPPVGYDPNLTNWASVNNGQQQLAEWAITSWARRGGRTPPWVSTPPSVPCG